MMDVARMLDLLGLVAKRRPGGELWAPCPSHSEIDPSWSISERDGSHYCFGCGYGGGPVELVQTRYGFAARSSALDWLERHGLGIGKQRAREVRLVVAKCQSRAVFRMPGEVCYRPIPKWPTPARRYLETRGIPEEQADRWRLGYAVEGRLRGRVVFPFENEAGQLESYSARTYQGEIPKYQTPAAEEGPDRSALFGMRHWPERCYRRELVITEGAIDALACERAGAVAVAALSGSRPSLGQFARLSTFPVVIVATDPDQAGERVWKQLQPLKRRITVVRATIPKGKDAASMVRADLEKSLWVRQA